MALSKIATDICFVISHGFAARTILHTQVLPLLTQQNLSVAVITPNATEESMQRLANEHGFHLEQLPDFQNRRALFYGAIRPYLYENVHKNPALWAKHLRALNDPATSTWRTRVKANLFMGVNQIARRSKYVRDQLGKIERRMLADSQAEQILARLNPQILVSTYPVSLGESVFLLAAEKLGIQTVGQLLSWDNITAKGRFTIIPDRFLVWGPIMKAEVEEYYGVPTQYIIETGAAHFDAHVTDVSADKQKEILQELNLDPTKPYILFGMSAPYFCPHEIDIVEWLAKKINAGALGPDLQLVVRPHPQNIQGNLADTTWLPRLESLRNGRVSIHYPLMSQPKSRLAWNIDVHDLANLVNLIHGCAICLNSGSTISIDAILHDRPVIITGFDAEHDLPWWQSIKRVQEYIHFAKMIRFGGTPVAYTFAELEDQIRRYLAHPDLDKDSRKRLQQAEVTAVDGRAAERIAQALASFVKEQATLA